MAEDGDFFPEGPPMAAEGHVMLLFPSPTPASGLLFYLQAS